MATYVIGDLQGCLDPLKHLLEKINYDPATDKLWFVGDLVNRGPQSHAALKFVHDLGENAITVLGNHDIHLLAVFYGLRETQHRDTLDDILAAEDAEQLIDWLRRRPLMHFDAELDTALVHAGIAPEWTLEQAAEQARLTEAQLAADHPQDFIAAMFGNKVTCWERAHSQMDQHRFTINSFTRMRYIEPDGRLNFKEKLAPVDTDDFYTPWFAVPERKTRHQRIVFGHWSTLGPAVPRFNAWGIDQGCLWGGQLTALRLEDEQIFQLDCARGSISRQS
ncbi:MAG TPA: symmetrical bis(5'-nucleosyl)-tetraphosphatase [Halothiobacillaceae bacterium]|nr:symmetrical bis(5'-nucleosyl)-tetraphosphatase [Halothiobacillaceae bacterium]